LPASLNPSEPPSDEGGGIAAGDDGGRENRKPVGRDDPGAPHRRGDSRIVRFPPHPLKKEKTNHEKHR